MANTNRSKGHAAEVLYMNIFKELGYIKCVTSRNGSKLIDNCKIDLMNIPFNVQIKCGYPKGVPVAKIFKQMDELMYKHLMDDDPIVDRPKLLIHRLQPGRGKKRMPKHDVAYFYVKDYSNFIPESAAVELVIHLLKFIPGEKPIIGVPFDVIKPHLDNFQL